MIDGAVNLFRTNPIIRSARSFRFRCVLVDEFQEKNFARLELIKNIGGDNLCIVGDDGQALYWLRCEVRNVLYTHWVPRVPRL